MTLVHTYDTITIILSSYWLILSLLTSSRVDQGLDLKRFPTKPSKTIDPPGKPESNTAHRVHNAVSPMIDLWVNEIPKCL
jgi:hypothetical protein